MATLSLVSWRSGYENWICTTFEVCMYIYFRIEILLKYWSATASINHRYREYSRSVDKCSLSTWYLKIVKK